MFILSFLLLIYFALSQLAVGDFGMSVGQQKAQMGMWALFSTPLFMSVDLRNIDDTAKQILQNKDIISINQDPIGLQARRTFKYNVPVSVWSFIFGSN